MATVIVGVETESKLSERDSNGNRIHTVESLFAMSKPEQKFKSFAGNTNIRRIKIPENGVW